MNRNCNINETSTNQAFIGTKASDPRNEGNETSNMNSLFQNNIHTTVVTMAKNCATSVQNETTITEGKNEEDVNNNIITNHHNNNINNFNNTSSNKHCEKEQNEEM